MGVCVCVYSLLTADAAFVIFRPVLSMCTKAAGEFHIVLLCHLSVESF